MQAKSLSSIPVVLTGSIVPSTGPVHTAADIHRRRDEYLAAIDWYTARSEAVYFLENSTYDLGSDAAFSRHRNLHIRKMPPSITPERGKGYQEFEMLDAWVQSEFPPPKRWIKITGRYLVENIDKILAKCEADTIHSAIIDQVKRSKTARTYIFFTTTDFYLKCICGSYKQCNDASGAWIERVLYAIFCQRPEQLRFFPTKPQLLAIAGGSGISYPNSPITNCVKQVLRSLNELADKRRLWFSA